MDNNLTLLYIEDDLEILENVSFLFERFVKKVYTAKDGEEALEVYKKHQPDIVVSDINIPKIDGLSVAAKIREENKYIPIIIITAHDESFQREKAKKIGVSSYLKKPFTLEQLKNVIAKAIQER